MTDFQGCQQRLLLDLSFRLHSKGLEQRLLWCFLSTLEPEGRRTDMQPGNDAYVVYRVHVHLFANLP